MPTLQEETPVSTEWEAGWDGQRSGYSNKSKISTPIGILTLDYRGRGIVTYYLEFLKFASRFSGFVFLDV